MKTIFTLMITAILTDNIVLSKFMGICPFLGVSKKLSSSLGMGAAVIFVMTCATLVTYPVYSLILEPYNLTYLRTVAFILIIALFVQLVEIVLKKVMPPLYNALGVYLPLITTNCAVLGVTLQNIDNELNFGYAVLNSIFVGMAFTLALILFSGVRSKLETADIPATFKGVPSTLIAASIVSLSFMAFSGLKLG
ncbi:MAG: RnfABCDGE type electron transport complex subunit A [Ruminococcus sp.]|nr:RnfABCDGE type electron transport complex subunit A [Ruminococcus sp.]MCI6889193.1 RnfABCDGE type electron transport complex subunit A [Ruminococcus sp.]MDY3214314.1 RnfABCDGE type electron transport complex subunit A [Ruminococcus sp.]HOF68193.1 RnfABCDGE type electron transport complex subunit A [Ruminococcus sp.]